MSNPGRIMAIVSLEEPSSHGRCLRSEGEGLGAQAMLANRIQYRKSDKYQRFWTHIGIDDSTQELDWIRFKLKLKLKFNP